MSADIKKWMFILTDEDAQALVPEGAVELTDEELEAVKCEFEYHTGNINDLLAECVENIVDRREP